MRYFYELIINGYLQEVFLPFETKDQALKAIAAMKDDGRLTVEDKVAIKTTIIIVDEVKL